MKEALQRAFARQAEQAKTKPVAKTTPAKKTAPAPRKAAVAAPAARHWGAPDPGVLKTVSMAPAAPQAKQSGLDNRMVAMAAEEAKRISR